jgi:hypothetical protein
MSAMLDTYKIISSLKAGGMPEAQAVPLVEGINSAMSENVATKKDLEALEGRLKSHVDVSVANARNLQIVWTIGAIAALGVIQHLLK